MKHCPMCKADLPPNHRLRTTCKVCECQPDGHEWVCADLCDRNGVKDYYLFCKWCAITKSTGIMRD